MNHKGRLGHKEGDFCLGLNEPQRPTRTQRGCFLSGFERDQKGAFHFCKLVVGAESSLARSLGSSPLPLQFFLLLWDAPDQKHDTRQRDRVINLDLRQGESDGLSDLVMKSESLRQPRIKKQEIKRIILGGGQNLLSPERSDFL